MAKGKKIAVTLVAVVVAAAVGLTAYRLWKKKDSSASKGKVFVTQVSDVNTAAGVSLSGSKFSGVIEAQKTVDYKYDSSKTVKSLAVKEGDEVKKGDLLFTYDVEAMQLELDQGRIEVERMKNEVETNKLQLQQLEEEKKKTPQDGQTSLNTQILSLQSDVAKAEYDIKTKKAENKKIKKSIKNAKVYSEVDGTVKSTLDLENIQNAESNVMVSISRGGSYLVKGTVNEQMINNIYVDMPVVIRSRVDENTTWTGKISSIETSPQKDNYSDMYSDGDSDSSSKSSKYAFYVEPDSLDGLMLGQHILIEPDLGEESGIDKKGIWLYSDYVFTEKGKSYVWAQDKNEKIEKREVKLGQKDENMGDVEILSGLKKDDYITYPSKNIKEGMPVTTNAEDPDLIEDDTENDADSDADNGGDDEIMPMDGDTEGDNADDPFAGYTIDDDGNFVDSEGNVLSDEEVEAMMEQAYGSLDADADNADINAADEADMDTAGAQALPADE